LREAEEKGVEGQRKRELKENWMEGRRDREERGRSRWWGGGRGREGTEGAGGGTARAERRRDVSRWRDGGREGRRDGGTEGRRDRGRRDGVMEGRRDGGTEGWRGGGRGEGRRRRRQRRREGGKEGGKRRGGSRILFLQLLINTSSSFLSCSILSLPSATIFLEFSKISEFLVESSSNWDTNCFWTSSFSKWVLR
jgi:hypothetical protein